ncbi:helix-turn-helix domain-containing protein [uncultured Ruminococcus sp.]|uniref:helix-turn-helix domain-containing protein n=1 Tax=uncultured Ruminococcus sp. TaxID=165186 RepID=UPI0025F532DA|nr:helix-turn-helix domain-containing protein [uncultured Ruminococcus sp.]
MEKIADLLKTDIDIHSISTQQAKSEQAQIPIMLTVRETAAKFGIAQHHARQLALTGKVRAVRAGKKILINAQSVVDYFNESTLISSETYAHPQHLQILKEDLYELHTK